MSFIVVVQETQPQNAPQIEGERAVIERYRQEVDALDLRKIIAAVNTVRRVRTVKVKTP